MGFKNNSDFLQAFASAVELDSRCNRLEFSRDESDSV